MAGEEGYTLCEEKLVWLFGTPLLSLVWPQVDDLNQRLASLILAAEENLTSVRRSNEGGWQSETNLQQWQDPAILTLLKMIDEGAQIMVNSMRDDDQAATRYDCSIVAWANVNRAGHFNGIHFHRGFLSGVYYVSADPDPTYRGQGSIHFKNPNAAPQISRLIAAPNIVRRRFPFHVRVTPEPGRMLVFPSWLEHWVVPHNSLQPRISVAFNVEFPFLEERH
jgi:uncharacterized protein (TIGR02466 family)